MEIALLGTIAIAFGHLLRNITPEYLRGFVRFKDDTKNLNLILFIYKTVGWLFSSCGRVVLYLSFLPLSGNRIRLIICVIIGLIELIVSIYLNIIIRRKKLWISIIPEVVIALIILTGIIDLLSFDGLNFIVLHSNY